MSLYRFGIGKALAEYVAIWQQRVWLDSSTLIRGDFSCCRSATVSRDNARYVYSMNIYGKWFDRLVWSGF
jgi:hypothetical protein